MTAFSGSFHGKTTWQNVARVPDTANHELSLVEIGGQQTCSDPRWYQAAVTHWGLADLTDGHGEQRGYFRNVRPDGDCNWGSFASHVTTVGEHTTLEGTWQLQGGTGIFQGITGSGTFQGQNLSPTEVAITWQGDYQL